MKIIGYCYPSTVSSFGLPVSPEHWVPSIPPGLVTDEGVVWREKEEDFKQVDLPSPLEIPDGCWLGVELDGTCTSLHPHDETEWRVTRATKAIQGVLHRPGDAPSAMRSVFSLHAGSKLLGISLPELHAALAKVRQSPQEPLEVTVRALATELARQR